MLNDDELRSALTTRLAELDPDVEAELGRLLDRAHVRARRRGTTYAVGLVAAVTVLALVLGRDLLPRAEAPEPADDVPVRALVPDRGEQADPADLAAGRYRAQFADPPADGLPDVEIDVPAGWGQDDDNALGTGPTTDPSTRRIHLLGRVLRVESNPCSPQWVRPAPGALGLARALSSLAGTEVTEPVPATLDGHEGYFLRLHGPRTEAALQRCTHGGSFLVYLSPGGTNPIDPGWTGLFWVLDVEGHPVLITASYGPDVTRAQQDELVEMVESISFTES